MTEYTLIDVDSHITESPGTWVDRVAARHRDRVPRVERIEGRDIWLIDGQPATPVGPTAPAGWPEPMPTMPRTYEDLLPAAYDAKARLELLDQVGIWAQLLYPNVGGFGGQRFLKLRDRELMYECVRAYNDWQHEWASADPTRLVPVASMPFWDADDCVKELERCAGLGFKTILFTGEPHRFDLPYLGEGYWDRLWAAASAHSMPVNLHVGGGEFNWDTRRMEQRGFAESFALEGLTLFHKNGQQVCDVLLSGLLPRFPQLRIVSVESGIGWMPFAMEAIDYQFIEGGGFNSRPEFDRLPSEYFADQVYITFWFEKFAIRELVGQAIPVGNVMWETDFPHPTCLYGDIHVRLDETFAGLDGDTRKRLVWDNAVELYGLDVPVSDSALTVA
ncbi:MAG: amidohydrolase family protein [Actinomycetota bacterium]|nr:amidohydrolase family protein [Actinomycetota bacterium]